MAYSNEYFEVLRQRQIHHRQIRPWPNPPDRVLFIRNFDRDPTYEVFISNGVIHVSMGGFNHSRGLGLEMAFRIGRYKRVPVYRAAVHLEKGERIITMDTELHEGRRLPDMVSGQSLPGDVRIWDYWKITNPTTGVSMWWCYLPVRGGGIGNLSAHDVTEHDDGTITVHPSILMDEGFGNKWHGYLENGVFRAVE